MQTHPSKYRWIIFIVLAAVIISRVPVGISLGVLLPHIKDDFGLSATQQGWWLGSALNYMRPCY